MNNNSRYSKKALVLAMASFASSMGVSAMDGALEEIIVTAQKRPQTLQDVPLAVSAFSEDTMKSLHFGDANDIFLYTPGLVSAPDFATPERTAIRGLGSEQFGTGFVNHVGVFVDGVYQEGTQSAELYDVERVEVIKGPVGALFGRSSIAGAISVTRNKPNEEFEGSIDVGLGELGRQTFTGVVNVPLSDKVFFRAAGKDEQSDGYLYNVATGEDVGATQVESARMALRFAGDKVDATLTAVYEERADAPNIGHATSSIQEAPPVFGLYPLTSLIVDPAADLSAASPFGESYKINSDIRPEFNAEFYDIVADISVDVSDNLTVKSLTSYRELNNEYVEDFDNNAIPDLTYFGPFAAHTDADYFQQEFHFTFTTDADTVIQFGSNYYQTDVSTQIQTRISDSFGAAQAFWDPALLGQTIIQTERTNTEGDFWGWSAFADLTLAITDKLDLTFGARYTYDEKELEVFVEDPIGAPGNIGFPLLSGSVGYTSSPIKTEDDWKDTTVRVALNYTVDDDLSLYAAYAQGSKSGGIDSFSFLVPADSGFSPFYGEDLAAVGATPKSVDAESSDSVEFGIKSYWLDRRVQFNTSAFFYRFVDQQRLITQGAAQIVENVGEVEGYGVETDLRFLPTENWDVSVNFSWLDVEVIDDESNPANEGEPTSRAPEWTASLIATYTYPLTSGASLYSNFSHSYQGEMRTDENPLAPYVPAFNLSNLRFGYNSAEGNWGASVYINNLFDEFVYYDRRMADGAAALQDIRRNIGRPRTAGVDFNLSF